MANDCWAKIDKTEGSLDTDLNIYFDKNETGENRSVKIRVTSPDGSIKKEYTLVQGEASVEIFYNELQSRSFTKQGCDSLNERGEVVEYVVPAGKYSSTISVADANRKALADIEANGQAYANEHGECITTVWYNTIQVGEFQKNDCNHDTEEGSTVTYVIAAGSYSSTVSQEDADRKAKEALEAGGQDYANRYGHCVPIKWYNTEMSQQFQKNDCLATEVGSMVTYTVPAGKYTSTISQEDANEQARQDIAENGQDYANEHGTCATDIWYNEEQKKTFTRNNCEDGKIGTDYEYVVPAGKYSSTVSQQDANDKALADIEENGQAMANLEGECIDDPNYFVGKASHVFTKEGCDPESEYGSNVTVTQDDVEGGPFISRVSQDEADELAMAAVMEQGQAIANERGECISKDAYTGKFSKEFTKNNCADGGTGSKVTVTQDDVTGGPFISYESQTAANSLAEEAVNEQGQDIANERGNCTWSGKYSQQFTKDDCEEGQYGSSMTVSEQDVDGYPFLSTESKAAADALAEAAVKEQGQAIANEEGTCNDMTVYTGRYSQKFTKNNCADGGVGSDVTVTQNDVTGGPFTSYESQEAANALAQEAVEEQGQEIANTRGNCTWTGEYSQSFQKNDCDEGQTGSTVEISADDCEGYPFTSTESKEAADALAEAAVKEQGQELANELGNCEDKPVFTGVYSQKFTKNDCADEGVGSEVTVTQNDVTGGPFTSYESQEEANALAQAAVEEQGQAVANTKGSCTWTGSYEQQFVKNDCEEGQQGSSMNVSDEDCVGYPFTSNVSQEDANNKAQEAVEAQGQGIANAQGTCNDLTVYTGNYSKDFTPECEHCEQGVEMEVTATMVNGSPVISYVSQDEADQEAKRIVEEGGQAYANKNGQCNPMPTDADWQNVTPEETECQEGKSMIKQQDMNECSPTYNQTKWVEGGGLTCSWNGKASQEFQKNDCPEGEEAGTMVTVTEADMASIEESGYPFTSFESQEAADDLAEAAVSQYGQQVANEKGSCNECGFYKKTFYRNDCGSCMEDLVGIEVTSDMVGGPFCDPDPEVAQQKAQQAVEENGQAYVNKNGPECTPMSTDPVWVDSDPLETECRDGVSYKKQVNTNDCYSGEQEQWVPGGGLTCEWTAPDSSEEYTRTCDHDGEGGTVTVQSSELPGYPFKSTVSEDDAIRIRDAAFAEHGEEVASGKPGWTCLWTATYSKQITRSDCGTCDKGTTVNVSSDQCGGPFTSNISYDDALSKAQQAVEELGQGVANKNGDCVNDPDKDYASWSDTGTTQCNGCTSQKQQRDTNQCSPTYNSTQWVNGGSRDCTENGSWGSWSGWDCSGCTATRTRTNTCGAVDTDTEYNSSHCGSMGPWSYTGSCSGTRSEKKRTHSCTGEVEYDYDYRECYCGYGGGDYNTPVGSATCRSGVSQRQYRDSCGDTIWRNEGSACTASYNCSNISDSSGSEGSCTYRCVYSGTQSASGSTTSEAEQNARDKCTCSKTYSYTRSCSGSCSGSEDGCSYTGTYTGGGTGTGSSCSAAQSDAPSCTCGGKTYTYNLSKAATNSDCAEVCQYGGTTNGQSQTVVGTGSSCSYAKTQAEGNWEDYLNSYPDRFCNCSKGSWVANIAVAKSCGGIYDVLTLLPYQMNYENECGTSKSVTLSWSCTRSLNTGSGTANGSVTITIPSGSGHTTGSASLNGTECTCMTLDFVGGNQSKSGNC